MNAGPCMAMLPDGRRLHLQHGPIDLVIEAFGARTDVVAAYRRACHAFDGLLEGLVAELPALRRPVRPRMPCLAGPVAQRMVRAVAPHHDTFVTPMAAVAGAVADHLLAALVADGNLARAYVNNGGDIALHLTGTESFDAGIVTCLDTPRIDGTVRIDAALSVRGIATSGRSGRSLSLGVADAVTVLAGDAAAADAAATLIANAVYLDHPAVERRPAIELDPDSDLGARLVTVAVAPLDSGSIEVALDSGARAAEALRVRRLIHAAFLSLQGATRVIGGISELLTGEAA